MRNSRLWITIPDCGIFYTERRGGVEPTGGGASTCQRPLASNMAPIGTKLCQNVFQTIPVNSIFGQKHFCFAKIFRPRNRFTPFWLSFGGSTDKRTSTATSSQCFALDVLLISFVRPKLVGNKSVGVPGLRRVGANTLPFRAPLHMAQGTATVTMVRIAESYHSGSVFFFSTTLAASSAARP